ncbi:hypothetical protein ROLI_009100 [Roseobacter fucihabitans]|uniref:Cytochrome b561 bacterial/Ni-hydrogenase domain-containing protein n=1 Tax=Roseobacter fucihabitans TaxID=1537242 RepID=A0ABZ2BPF5_9RHOB|nr:hypothetical protein [Roseobacter litoralis]MBC6967395.1 hypothetical protein [Roseobacter litoralis]
MSRRRATILLHWSAQVLLLLSLASGLENPVLAGLFGCTGIALVALALVFGLMNGPGPKLEGALRRAHPWLSRLMYALLGWTSISMLALAFGRPLPGPEPRTLMITLFAAAALHGIFHLWRHTTLGDGALRRITPKSIHGML